MNELKVLERENQRVLTTEQLAEVYGTDVNNIQNNFNNNKDKFIENKHYYLLKGDDLKAFKSQVNNIEQPINKFASQLYLWTERGANRHCKILDTEKAWEQFENLEETYFKIKNEIDIKQLDPKMQMFKLIFDSVATTQMQLKEQEVKLIDTNTRIDNIKEVIALDSTAWRADTQNLLNKIAISLGGTSQFYRQLREESYELLDRRMGVSLRIRLTNKKRRMAEDGVSKSRRETTTKLDVIADDKRLIEGYVAIVKEMAIKYGIADKKIS